MKNLFSAKEDQTKFWQDFLVIPGAEVSYKDKLEALLDLLNRHLQAKLYHLYLLSPEGGRFILEHTKMAEEINGDHKITTAGEAYSDDARSIIGAPILEISYSEDYETSRLVATPVGQLLTVPLRVSGGTVGLIQVGPIYEERMSKRLEQQIASLLPPFCLALAQVRKIQHLSEQLRMIEKRAEVGQKLLGSAFEADKFISLLLELSLKATGTEAGFVAIVESGSDHFAIRASKNIPEGFLKDVDLLPGRGLFDWLSETEKSLIVRDWEFVIEKGIRSILAVPLLAEDDLLGVFALINFEKEETFAEYSLRLLTDFSRQIGLVLDNARLMEIFSQRYLETMKALAKSIDMRYPGMLTHSERVTRTALEIARGMNLSVEDISAIETAGLIHDVGMAAVTEIARGFRADYEHPTIGASMIEFLPWPTDIAGMIKTHHEWYDGWGFPEGLKGEEIPIGGRILALAEFFVESTTPGEVHRMMKWEELYKELMQRRGSQFDPMVVDAFLELMKGKRERAGDGQLERCVDFHCCPPDIASHCPAAKGDKPCWEYADTGCRELGYEKCEDCFLYREWEDRRDC